MDEIIKDFDWELDRFVEYRPPFTQEKKHCQLKNQFSRFRVGTEIVIDLK